MAIIPTTQTLAEAIALDGARVQVAPAVPVPDEDPATEGLPAAVLRVAALEAATRATRSS
jgi:hypothetical protein